MATTAPPCPQAARAPGIAPKPPQGPIDNVADLPVLPLGNIVSEALPNQLVDPTFRWPYHLPSFNGVDCLWWGMLVRSMYAADDTWLRRVAEWAGPVTRLKFVNNSQPARQAHGLVELNDSVLVVIPGTSSEVEALQYFLTHSLRIVVNTDAGWSINGAWAARGVQVLLSYNTWPPPTEVKPVVVIGHSSGSAYGAYVMYSLASDSQHPWTLATYGAPIWGTDSLATYYANNNNFPKTLDFCQPNDVVPTLPPPWAMIDVLLPLTYALTGRPNYRRINNVLMLSGNQAPTPTNQPFTLEALANAAVAFIREGTLDVQHSTRSYTTAADRWAANDPTITANQLTPAYNALKQILTDMNSANVG